MTLPAARLTPAFIHALFNEALTQEFGMILPVEAAYHDNARTMFSTTLKNHPDRDKIMICAFPEDGEFFFAKKTVDVI